MLLLSKSIALEKSQQTFFPAPVCCCSCLVFLGEVSLPRVNHWILSTASSKLPCTESNAHLESAIRKKQHCFLHWDRQSNSIFSLMRSFTWKLTWANKKLKYFCCTAWNFWMKFLERHSALPTAFPYKTHWKSILRKSTEPCSCARASWLRSACCYQYSPSYR